MLSNLEDMYWGWEHTAKTFLAMLAALERQPTAQHFACLHDDVYVHAPRLAERLRVRNSRGHGLYFGNAYTGHEFVGHAETDVSDYEALHGHRLMPVVMKGGLWVVDRLLVMWVASALSGPAALIPWKLWASDDDSVGLVFGELDIDRVHGLRHGVEWFDWRLGDRCDGEQLIIAHDLKTPRELMDIWARQLFFDNPCHDAADGEVRWSSRPQDFMPAA